MSKFWHNFPEITKEHQIDFGQGNTPLIHLTNNKVEFYLKDETRNPNGSFKDRGLSYQLARHIMNGKHQFALSSSGNAAISALHIAKLYNLELNIFIADSINLEKLNYLQREIGNSTNIRLLQSKKPRSELIKFINKNNGYVNLRGSTDIYAPSGYKTIAVELIEELPGIDAIFIPTSSGTSAVGIASGFRELGVKVQIHICQSSKIHPIAKAFDTDHTATSTSLADAITDRVAHRKIELQEIIKKTQGSGWILSDDDLRRDKKIIDSKDIGNFSFNSILAFSGFQKALNSGYNFKNPVLLFSGL